LALMFAVLVDASEGWHGLRMNDALRARLEVMRTDPDTAWEDPDLKDLAA